jgi:hypothetical protein
LQLLTLFVGIGIGVMIAPRFDHKVNAQTAPTAASTGDESRVITLQSYSSGPALAANVVLAGELQADHATVNGYDLLKIDQNIINYLANLPVSNRSALESIVASSKSKVRYALPSQRPVTVPRSTSPSTQTPQDPK